MIDIFCNGVKITPMGEGLTLSLTGGVFGDLARTYSTSFDIVRTPEVDRVLKLDTAIFDFCADQLHTVACDVQLNGHQQYGTLQVESITPTTASLTLYVSVVDLPESVLAMTLHELGYAAVSGNATLVPFGLLRQPAIGQSLASGTRFAEYQSGFEDTSDVTVWGWQFPVATVSRILSYINALVPSINLSHIASAMTGVNVLCNSFYIPNEAPATAYVESDNGIIGLGYQKSVHFEIPYIGASAVDFTAKYAGNATLVINYYYNHTDSTYRRIYIYINGVMMTSYPLNDTPSPSSQTELYPLTNLSAGDTVRVELPWGSVFDFAAHIRMYGSIQYGDLTEADRHLPYESIVKPNRTSLMANLAPSVQPAFQYMTFRSSLPKITVKDFLAAMQRLLGIGGALTPIATAAVEGTIDAIHPDNDTNGQGGYSLTLADGSVIYDVEPTAEDASKNDMDVALWQAAKEPDQATGYSKFTAVVQNFEHSYGTPDEPTAYIDSTKAREGAMVLTTDDTYNGNSIQGAYDVAANMQFATLLNAVRLKPTADITAWQILDWVLFPDIIYINGWRVYVTESSIDTDTGFYTFKGILTE